MLKCGVGGWYDRVEVISANGAHTGSNLKLTFTTSLDEDAGNESFGFRELIVEYDTIPEYYV